jgi:hypothetical protein
VAECRSIGDAHQLEGRDDGRASEPRTFSRAQRRARHGARHIAQHDAW